MCCAKEAVFYCWCSPDKKGLFFFDEDNDDSVDDHDNAGQKEKEEFASCFVWTKPKKNYEIRQMKYTPPEKMLWFGQFVKLMCSSCKKNRVCHKNTALENYKLYD